MRMSRNDPSSWINKNGKKTSSAHAIPHPHLRANETAIRNKQTTNHRFLCEKRMGIVFFSVGKQSFRWIKIGILHSFANSVIECSLRACSWIRWKNKNALAPIAQLAERIKVAAQRIEIVTQSIPNVFHLPFFTISWKSVTHSTLFSTIAACVMASF